MEEKIEKETAESRVDLSVASDQKIFDGKYLLVQELGRGASGVVYKAKHLNLDQYVALKVVDSRYLESPQQLERFQKEASLLCSFIHPNIVKFISYGKLDDGSHYMVLEFLEGKNLADLIASEKALTQKRALPLFQDIAAALSYAHKHGVIHRDVKPGNVMVCQPDTTETAKLLDFGIVKSVDTQTQSLTQTGLILGSANYMSPEQCKSQPVDVRSDLYSLGCLMYETLVGQAPMQDDSDLSIMSNHLNKAVSAVPAKFGISAGMEKIILKLLQKDPKNRFQNTVELIEELEKCKNAVVRKAIKIGRNHIAVLGVLFLLVTGLAIKALNTKNQATKIIQKDSKRPRLSGPMPLYITDVDDGLAKMSEWLESAIDANPPNEDWLVGGLLRFINARSHFDMDEVTNYSLSVEQVLKSRKQGKLTSKETSDERLQRLAWLALVQVINKNYEGSEQTIKAMERQFKTYPQAKGFLCTSYRQMAGMEYERGNYKSGITYCKRALPLANPNMKVLLHSEEAHGYYLLADFKSAQASAHEAYLCALEIFRSGHRLNSISDLGSLVDVLYNTKQHKESIDLIDSFLKSKQFQTADLLDAFDKNKNVQDVDQLQLHLYFPLARAYLNQGDYAKAETLLRALRKLCLESKPIKENINIANQYLWIALEAQNKDFKKELFANVAEVKEKGGRADYLNCLTDLMNARASLFSKDARFRELSDPKIINEYLKTEPYSASVILYDRACFLANMDINKLPEAIALYKAIEKPLAETKTAQSRHLLIWTYIYEMTYLARLKDSGAAEEVYRKAKSISAVSPPDDFALDYSYANMLVQNKKQEQAIKICREIMDRYKDKSIKNTYYYYNCANLLSTLYYKAKQKELAAQTLEHALKQLKKYRALSWQEIVPCYNLLAAVYKEMDKSAEASSCLEQARLWSTHAEYASKY